MNGSNTDGGWTLFFLPSSGQRGDAVWSSDNAEDGDSRGEADCSLQTVWGDPLSSPQVELEKLPHARCILKDSSCKTFRVLTGILTFRLSSKKIEIISSLPSFMQPGPFCQVKQLLDGLALDPAVFTGQSSPLPGPVLLFLLFLPSLLSLPAHERTYCTNTLPLSSEVSLERCENISSPSTAIRPWVWKQTGYGQWKRATWL